MCHEFFLVSLNFLNYCHYSFESAFLHLARFLHPARYPILPTPAQIIAGRRTFPSFFPVCGDTQDTKTTRQQMLSWLRPDDVLDAQPNNNNYVAKRRRHATCSCITRNGKPQERRRCKIHQNPTPASNNYHVEGKRQHAICSCKTKNGNPMEARRCKILQKSTKPIQAQVSLSLST